MRVGRISKYPSKANPLIRINFGVFLFDRYWDESNEVIVYYKLVEMPVTFPNDPSATNCGSIQSRRRQPIKSQESFHAIDYQG